MRKILILGSAGMLGHMVYNYLNEEKRYELIGTSFRTKANANSHRLDITDKLAVESFIKYVKPDIVINCIGVLIRASQQNPSDAIYINSYFPHQLSNILRVIGGKLIHISTDCVFSGKKGEYSETDIRDADDIYGRSKALGEVINEHDLTLRTSIIGPELKESGEGLFDWFMKQKGEVAGFKKAFWGGVTTLELAKVINDIIEQNYTGLLHITNGTKISKYDLIHLFKCIWGKNNINIKSIDGKSYDKSLVSLRTDINLNIPQYKKMLEDQNEWMQLHLSIYEKYFS